MSNEQTAEVSNEQQKDESVQTETAKATENTATEDRLDTDLLDDSNDFLDSIPAEFRSEPSLKSIKSQEALLKSYIHAQKELGGRVRIPKADAEEAQKQEFFERLKEFPELFVLPSDTDEKKEEKLEALYNKLGRPESPDKYEVKVPDTIPADEEYVNLFKSVAYKEGLTQKQVDALVQLETGRADMLDRFLREQKKSTAEYLQKTWGENYNSNLNLAKKTLAKFASSNPDAVEDLRTGYAGSNPVVIEILYEMAKLNQEEPIMSNNEKSQSPGLTEQTIRDKILSIRSDRSHPFNIANHPQHDQAVAELNALYVQIDQLKQGNQ